MPKIIRVTYTTTSTVVYPSLTATTTTTTTTSTSTATSTVFTATVTVINDYFQVTIRSRGPNNGRFANILLNTDMAPNQIQVNQPQMMASSFSLSPDGTFRTYSNMDPNDMGREIAEWSSFNPNDPARLYVVGTGGLTPANRQRVSCTVMQSPERYCLLTCMSPRGSVSFTQGRFWSVGGGTDVTGPPPREVFQPYILIQPQP